MLTTDESDLDEGDHLNDSFPFLSIGGEDTVHKETDDKMDTDYLLDAEFSDQHRADELARIAKEINLFDLEEDTFPVNQVAIVEDQRQILLNPPGVPFFTGHPHQLYTEETLVWPFTDASNNRFARLSDKKIDRYIREGLFQIVYSSGAAAKLMMKYLFHLCCCTTDEELLYPVYNTLCFIAENNESHMSICQELYLALANFGADLKKHGKDPSAMKSSVLPDSLDLSSEQSTETTTLSKRNITLMLQFLAVLLTHSKKCTEDDLDELIKIFIVIGLDPIMINSGVDTQISACVSRTLDLYPSKPAFYLRVPGIVEEIVTYCDFHHHTVTHVCTMYIMPTPLGQILQKSVAFLQVELALQAEEKNILDIVEVDDVVELIKNQLDFISQEEDLYVLHSVMKLLVCCVGNGPFTPSDKKGLSTICSLLESIRTTKRQNVDDLYSSLFQCYSRTVLDKWRFLSQLTGRQQTLHEVQPNSSQKLEGSACSEVT